MAIITDLANFDEAALGTNAIQCDPATVKLIGNCSIEFRGENNILVIEPGVELVHSTITFGTDNAVVYLSASPQPYRVAINANRDSVTFFGKNNYFNQVFTTITSERKNIIVGNDGLFSFGIVVRTADPHLIYDARTTERINPSRSVLIGDHVWVGQSAMLLKGSQVGSGAIVAGGAIVSNKEVPSNSVFAGNPGKVIKREIFFHSASVHNWTVEHTEKFQTMDTKEFIYEEDAHTISLAAIDALLEREGTSAGKLEVVREYLVAGKGKNRFFIGETAR